MANLCQLAGAPHSIFGFSFLSSVCTNAISVFQLRPGISTFFKLTGNLAVLEL
jgi:hypothetical protein